MHPLMAWFRFPKVSIARISRQTTLPSTHASEVGDPQSLCSMASEQQGICGLQWQVRSSTLTQLSRPTFAASDSLRNHLEVTTRKPRAATLRTYWTRLALRERTL